MNLTFELCDGDRRFTKNVEMLAVPQVGTECDPDDGGNYRAVKQVYHKPNEILVWVEFDQSDTSANLKKLGWKKDGQ